MRGQLVRRELGEQHPSERVRVGGQAVARTQVELDRAVGLHPLDEQHVGIGQDPQGRAHAQLAREPAQVGAHGTGQPQGAEIAVSQFDAAGQRELAVVLLHVPKLDQREQDAPGRRARDPEQLGGRLDRDTAHLLVESLHELEPIGQRVQKLPFPLGLCRHGRCVLLLHWIDPEMCGL